MLRLIRIFAVLFSLSLRRQLAFRAELGFEIVLTVVGMASSLTALAMVFSRTSTLGGWTAYQVVTVLGTFQIVSAARDAFVEPSLRWLGKQVQEGEFDAVLTQPAPAVFLMSFGSCAPLALGQAVLGLGVVGVGLAHQGGASPGRVGAWIVLVLCGIAVMWATRALTAALVFLAMNFSLDVVYDALWRFAGYPVSIYRRPLRVAFTYVVPVALVATTPVGVASGSGSLLAVPVAVAVAAGLCGLTVLVWRYAVRRYTSATS